MWGRFSNSGRDYIIVMYLSVNTDILSESFTEVYIYIIFKGVDCKITYKIWQIYN